MDIAGNEERYLSVTHGQYLLTGRDCVNQTVQHIIDIQEGWIPGFFVSVSVSEAICFLVSPASPTDVHYSMDEKTKLTKVLRQKEVAIRRSLLSLNIGVCNKEVVVIAAHTVYATIPTRTLELLPERIGSVFVWNKLFYS